MPPLSSPELKPWPTIASHGRTHDPILPAVLRSSRAHTAVGSDAQPRAFTLDAVCEHARQIISHAREAARFYLTDVTERLEPSFAAVIAHLTARHRAHAIEALLELRRQLPPAAAQRFGADVVPHLRRQFDCMLVELALAEPTGSLTPTSDFFFFDQPLP